MDLAALESWEGGRRQRGEAAVGKRFARVGVTPSPALRRGRVELRKKFSLSR